MAATTTLDIMGVVESVDPAGTITRRDGSETEKRNLIMRDDSNKSIEVTLWAAHAENPGSQLEEVSYISDTTSQNSIVYAIQC